LFAVLPHPFSMMAAYRRPLQQTIGQIGVTSRSSSSASCCSPALSWAAQCFNGRGRVGHPNGSSQRLLGRAREVGSCAELLPEQAVLGENGIIEMGTMLGGIAGRRVAGPRVCHFRQTRRPSPASSCFGLSVMGPQVESESIAYLRDPAHAHFVGTVRICWARAGRHRTRTRLLLSRLWENILLVPGRLLKTENHLLRPQAPRLGPRATSGTAGRARNRIGVGKPSRDSFGQRSNTASYQWGRWAHVFAALLSVPAVFCEGVGATHVARFASGFSSCRINVFFAIALGDRKGGV